MWKDAREVLSCIALTSLISVTSVLPHYENDRLTRKCEKVPSFSCCAKEKRVPLAEINGRTKSIFFHVIRKYQSSKASNTSKATIRLNHCSYLRGGSQANQPATWPDPRAQSSDQVVRDKDSEMTVQESAQNLPSDPTKYFTEDSKMNTATDESAKFDGNQETAADHPEAGNTNFARKDEYSANHRDTAADFKRRDFELAQLFESGSCRREDIDDRCMRFIHDIDPALAAEVPSPAAP